MSCQIAGIRNFLTPALKAFPVQSDKQHRRDAWSTEEYGNRQKRCLVFSVELQREHQQKFSNIYSCYSSQKCWRKVFMQQSQIEIIACTFKEKKITSLVNFPGFPSGSDGKASACNAGELGSIPGSGRSPRKGNSNPLQYTYLENSMDMDGGTW